MLFVFAGLRDMPIFRPLEGRFGLHGQTAGGACCTASLGVWIDMGEQRHAWQLRNEHGVVVTAAICRNHTQQRIVQMDTRWQSGRTGVFGTYQVHFQAK